MTARRTGPALALLIVATGGAATIHARGIRGELAVVGAYLDYPVLVRDSLPEDRVPGDGTTRRLPDGTVVTCVPGGFCYWYRSGSKSSANPVVQDLRLTAWPGWRGVSSRWHLRGRAGGDAFWPRSAEELEVLNAWVDVDRGAWRVRAGRQEKSGGLGFHAFDGAGLLWKGRDALRVELFGGRSLARTVLAGHTGDLLRDADDLAPDRAATLLGVEVRARPGPGLSGAVLYQRELRTDRAGLYSERMAGDARFAGEPLDAEASADFDVATGAFNEARLRLTRSLRPGLDLAAEARYHRPYFELWTIWGAFSPVGFTQLKVDAFWTARPGLRLSASAARRDYEETRTGADFAPIEGDGWFARAGGDWEDLPWSAAASLGAHGGFGAFRSALDLSGGRRLETGGYAGLFAAGTQQFAEFRFGEGTTRGAGAEARLGAGALEVDGRLGIYRHTFDNRPGFDDYSQVRGRVAVRLRFGSEPGVVSTRPAGEWKP